VKNRKIEKKKTNRRNRGIMRKKRRLEKMLKKMIALTQSVMEKRVFLVKVKVRLRF
jgi:hypothetical protein